IVEGEGGEGEDGNADVLQAARAAQFGQVDDGGGLVHAGAHAAGQVGGRQQGAAGGDQVIDQQHGVALAQAVGLHFDNRVAIFGLVGLFQQITGQLALL